MRILVLTERYYPEKFLINDLVLEWQSSGYKITVLTQAPSYPFDSIPAGYLNRLTDTVEDNIRVVRFKTHLGYKKSLFHKICNYFLFMLRAVWYAPGLARKHDVMFVYHTGPLSQALALVPVKIFARKKTVIWTQDVWPDTVFAYGFPSKGIFSVILKFFVKIIYAYCDEVLVSSPGFVNRLRPYVRPDTSVKFIPQWVPAEFALRQASGMVVRSDVRKFIFTGNIGSVQNLERVIAAFAKVGKSVADLFILGDGSYRHILEDKIRRNEIENVHFLGSVDLSKVLSVIDQCDFTVLPLEPNPLLKLTIPAKFQTYLYAGKPILAVCGGEVSSFIEKNRLGLCADPLSVDNIANSIKEMCAIDFIDLKEIQSNLNIVLSQFNRHDLIKQLEACLL